MKDKFLLHTVTCQCGWSYGPSTRKRVKRETELHKEIHRLEKLANSPSTGE